MDMDWHDYVRIDPRYYRPTEVDYLEADTSKAKKDLGWEPKVKFHELVRIMVDADLELFGLESPGEGRKIIEEKFSGWHCWDDQVVSMGR
jgi:GDPmannose 4,6-dehydratase